MSEIYTVKGKTVAEAMQIAAAQYGGDGKELSYEIINREKSGIFGFGKRDAEIRVTVSASIDADLSDIVNEFKSSGRSLFIQDEPSFEKTDEAENGQSRAHREDQRDAGSRDNVSRDSDKTARRSIETDRKNSRAAQPRQTAPVQKKKAQKSAPNPKAPAAKVNEASLKKNEQPTDKSVPKHEETSSRPQKKNDDGRAKTPVKPDPKAEPAIKNGVSENEMNFAISFVNKMIAGMKLDAAAVPAEAPEGAEYIKEEGTELYPAINIIGADTGILIGHHGETLDAIQYLVNLALYRRDNTSRGRDHIKITVDIENYRAKREETLRSLARRMAARAVKYRRNMFLEPMNPYERRIIHSELQNFEGVSTHSVGSDVNRKIVITYEGASRGYQGGKRKGGGGVTKQEPQSMRIEKAANTDIPSPDESQTESEKEYGELSTASRVPLPTLDD